VSGDLAARIDRLESLAAIQQLPIRYAIAVDGRDLDAWVGLFVPDVHCGRKGRGHEVLRSIIEPSVRTFYRSIHQICGHQVTLDDTDHAHGIVYCRAEHEDDGKWVVMAIAYFDTYERHWYAADWEERPTAPFTGWSTHDAPPDLPQHFETWQPFWAQDEAAHVARLTRQPADRLG
jgi:hypothetical protein